MDYKDKIISEIIEANDIMTPLERFMDDQHNCPLCGTELLLTHVTKFVDLQTHEEAQCDACNIQVRSVNHILQ